MKIRIFTILSFLVCLTSCSGKYRLSAGEADIVLKENEGYLGFVINTLDPLYSIQMLNNDTGNDFYIGSVSKGISQITLKLPEGEYCFIGFDVYNWRVDYTDKGFCTYVEAGELNFFNEFIVRNPVTSSYHNYSRYIALLKKDHPQICKKYVNEDCSL